MLLLITFLITASLIFPYRLYCTDVLAVYLSNIAREIDTLYMLPVVTTGARSIVGQSRGWPFLSEVELTLIARASLSRFPQSAPGRSFICAS